jgi:hypothetical protein
MGRPYSEELRSRIVAAVEAGLVAERGGSAVCGERELRGEAGAARPANRHACTCSTGQEA